MQIACAAADADRVAASVIQKRNVQGLMDVADPMPERFQGEQSVCIAFTPGSQNLLIAQNGGQDAFLRHRTLV
jgi:hypothetical protein